MSDAVQDWFENDVDSIRELLHLVQAKVALAEVDFREPAGAHCRECFEKPLPAGDPERSDAQVNLDRGKVAEGAEEL